MPILCSIEPAWMALRSPTLPSASGTNLGTRNSEMPLVPAGASGRRASTRCRMFSARSCSPAVMKILVPVSAKLPSGCGSALVLQDAQVGAAVRLGQAHGAGPLARDDLGQVHLLLLVGAVGVQALVGAVRQARVHQPGLVGRVQHFVQAVVDDGRQTLAAELRVAAERRPAVLDELRVGFLETGRRGDHAVAVVGAAFAVADLVERLDHLAGEAGAFLQHRVDGLDVQFGVGRQGLEFVLAP